VSENYRAGVVEVSCQPNHDGSTTATVTYDMTALSDDGETALHDFAAHYQQYMEHWHGAIAATVGRSGER
jgi:hypothetical protein